MVTKEGARAGSVKDIFFLEGNDPLVVKKGGGEILVPFTAAICVEVNLEERKIVIDPPEGLLDLDEI